MSRDEGRAPDLARPSGLREIAYRRTSWATARDDMHLALSRPNRPGLRALTTRESSDWSIGLIDAFAVMCDVVSFYQERIVNESYLHTATERLSVRMLARSIGYELAPGMAVGTDLLFTCDESEEAPRSVLLPAGLRVQSIPGPGEEMLTYELVEAIEARPEWNAMRPLLVQAQSIRPAEEWSYEVSGLGLGIAVGDRMLFDKGDQQQLNVVLALTERRADERTALRLGPVPIRTDSSDTTIPDAGTGNGRTSLLFVDEGVGKDPLGVYESAKQQFQHKKAFGLHQDLGVWKEKLESAARQLARPPKAGWDLSHFRVRAPLFGHDALPVLDPPVDGSKLPTLERADHELALDRVYPEIVPGSIAAIEAAGEVLAFVEVTAVEERTLAHLAVKGRATVLTISPALALTKDLAVTVVHAAPAMLELPSTRIPEQVIAGDEISLDGLKPELEQGRRVVIEGEELDYPGVVSYELRRIAGLEDASGRTTLELDRPLDRSYVPETVRVRANVGHATHGETRAAVVLGSGDDQQAFQRFRLSEPDMTWVSGSGPGGIDSSLEIRIDGILWSEVPSLAEAGPRDLVYETHLEEDGHTTIVFGDGRTGARLPTGSENVVATYRIGIGTIGRVRRHQLAMLADRPLGLEEVTNPFAAVEGADPEAMEDARQNAPVGIQTLGRVVSLRDYEDFARAHAGLAKASASWAWTGEHRSVFLTVAGEGGVVLDPMGTVLAGLRRQLRERGDPGVHVRIAPYRPVFFRLGLALAVDPRFVVEEVQRAVEERLRRAFSFEARDFGQPVARSELLALVHGTDGVVAARVTRLHRDGEDVTNEPLLRAMLPGPGSRTEAQAAELLRLHFEAIDIGAMS